VAEVKKQSEAAPPRGPRRVSLIGAGVIGLIAICFIVAYPKIKSRIPAIATGAPRPVLEGNSERQIYSAYGGSPSCRECHEEEYQLWEKSHHRLAQRQLEPKLEDTAFRPERLFRHEMQATTLRKSGNDYEVMTTGLRTTQELFHVESVIGVSPLQQFLVSFPGSRLQTLEASYDPRSNQWFSVYANEDRRPGEWGHWTGRGMNWNSMCASCHNTRLRKNYDEASDAYHTIMAETAVGCEACHGPLGAHDDWQKHFGKSGDKDPTLPKWSPAQVMDNCGLCHARRGDLTGDFKPGDAFADHLRLEVPDDSQTFYADGQVCEEDYEYAAFLGSRMHARGVRCTDCHDPHSAKTILPGNWLCMRCHNGAYTNAPSIDPVAHSHHNVFGYDPKGVQVNSDLMVYQAGTVKETGGECVNCHMPQTVYMQRHWRHDHGFTIPDPLLSKELGIPNACNRCHSDRDIDWAAKYCREWYGPKMDRPYRWRARVIAAARFSNPSARLSLVEMLTTNDIPYWRAVAAGLLERWADETPVRNGLLFGLNDTNALVRAQCVRALEPVSERPSIAAALASRLEDSTRAVRLAAAWALRSNLDFSATASKELLHSLVMNADQPAGQMQLGALALARGMPAQAVKHYQKAVEWDPTSAVTHHDYGVVLSSLNRAHEAVEQLQAACGLEPTNAEFQYKLGLGWNELGQNQKTIECLQAAVRLDHGYARAWYNLGLALNSDARTEEALEALGRAESADSSDPRSPYARATILARLGKLEEARRAAQRALEIEPRFEPARELLRSLAAANGRE
jgi:tetratricopeptide (TPR) repeat protein